MKESKLGFQPRSSIDRSKVSFLLGEGHTHDLCDANASAGIDETPEYTHSELEDISGRAARSREKAQNISTNNRSKKDRPTGGRVGKTMEGGDN